MKKGFVGNIEEMTTTNTDYRRVLYTGKFSQLVLMNLKPGEEIGEEVHDDVDQFFRFEEGEGAVIIDGAKHRVQRRQRRGRAERRAAQRGQHLEDGRTQALHHLLAARAPGRDRPEDQEGRGRAGRALRRKAHRVGGPRRSDGSGRRDGPATGDRPSRRSEYATFISVQRSSRSEDCLPWTTTGPLIRGRPGPGANGTARATRAGVAIPIRAPRATGGGDER